MPSKYIDLDDLLQQAFREGRDVDLVQAERYGYQIEIDGVAITDDGRGNGLPRESFGWPVDDGWVRSPEGEEMIDELVQGVKGYRARRQNESVETSNQSASEGIPLGDDS